MLDQPPQCYSANCPLAGKAKGFGLDSGDPATAKFAVLLEALGGTEILCDVERELGREEIERRRKLYPELDERWLKRGGPVVGPAGLEMWSWALKGLGVIRKDVLCCNTLRCLPPKQGEQNYPIGDIRKRAESCCRMWDAALRAYNPTVALVNIHPAAVVREPTPLPLQINCFRKALDFSRAGERPLVLCGGKAAEWWCDAPRNPTRWIGSYQWETPETAMRREARRLKGLEVTVGGKVKKPKKLTARTALAELLGHVIDPIEANPEDYVFMPEFHILKSEYQEMFALTQPMKRTKKEPADVAQKG